MFSSPLILAAAFLAFGNVLCLPVLEDNKYVIHEHLSAVHPRWERQTKLPRENNPQIQMRIAIAQQNVHRGEHFLMEVSEAASPLYGQHWTAEKIASVFSPSEESVKALEDWLLSSGVKVDEMSRSRNGGWLDFKIGLEGAEQLLRADYSLYTDSVTGESQIACSSYSVPESIRKHIDFILPTVNLIAKRNRRRSVRKVTDWMLPPIETSNMDMENSQMNGLANCDILTTPDCLRALYNVPNGLTANPKNTYGILEISPQTYSQLDLDLFFANFSPPLVGQPPKLVSVDGGAILPPGPPPITTSTIEGNLDLSYAMSLVYPQNVSLYQIGDTDIGGSFDLFLDAVDGSYCTYLGGDDPTHDPNYPDNFPGGYNETRQCGGVKPPNVLSISYGGDEAYLTPLYTARMCNEYMKLGLLGISVIFSSGDEGVAGNQGCLDPVLNGTTFNPEFPTSCPYVTSVGATQINVGSTVRDAEVAIDYPVVSGGGFSNYFPMPSYQRGAVLEWFDKHPTGYGPNVFNDSRQARGFPDVAALGRNYIIGVAQNLPYVQNNTYELVGGTSASAPVFGSILTLINEARLNIGRGPVGFVNPVLYAHPEITNDIVSGSNPGCGTIGFKATTGWDPVTGLGTPNFPKMLSVFLSLP